MKKTIRSLIFLVIISAMIAVLAISAGAEVITPTETVANTVVEFDTETGTLTIDNWGGTTGDLGGYAGVLNTFDVNWDTGEIVSIIHDFMQKHKNEIKHIKIDLFNQIVQDYDQTLFYGLPALESINFADGQVFNLNPWTDGTNTMSGILENCPKLTTVWFGDETNKIDGCVNLTGMSANYIGNAEGKEALRSPLKRLLKDCTSVTKVILPEGSTFTLINDTTFDGCTALEEVTIPANYTTISDVAFQDCTNLKVFNAVEGSVAYEYGVSKGYIEEAMEETVITPTETVANTVVEFDTETGTLTIDNWGGKPGDLGGYAGVLNTFDVNWDTGEVVSIIHDFMQEHKNEIKHIKIDLFDQIVQDYDQTLFYGLPALESINFADGQVFNLNPWTDGTNTMSGILENCPKLTTVWFGDETNKIDGCVNLTGMSADYIGNAEGKEALRSPLKRLLKDCTSVTKVILPEGSTFTLINDTTFDGCTSLISVTIPANFSTIEDGAFDSCTALTEINYSASPSLISGTTFTSTKGAVIYCNSIADATAINNTLEEANVPTSTIFAFTDAGMTIEGYQVRTSGYNGLRTLFSFNETAPEGYTLVEYGSIVATAENWIKYDQSFGGDNSILKLSGDEFVTSASNIIKTPVYQNGAYVNNSAAGENGRNFAVTVVRFEGEEQIKAEIINSGYEIWQKGDSYYVIFTREQSYGYYTTSLYKTTLGMLSADVIDLKKDDADPVWSVLNSCTKTTLETDNESVTGMLLADPFKEGNYFALYVTDAAEETTFTYLGVGSDMKAKISAFIYGPNVKSEAILIDSYWEEHIDAKLASLPEGKSFIYIVDTHWDGNQKKSTDLIKYVRSETGIKTVVHGGDPFGGPSITNGAAETAEGAKEAAEDIFYEAMYTNFYGVYGDNALYTVGNHEANIAGFQTDLNAGIATEEDRYKYYISDSFIYNTTVANIADKVEFDEALISKIENGEITFEANGGYTAEQMKQEALAWAKMHYVYTDTENKIRYIVVDTGDCGLTTIYTLGGCGYDTIIPLQFDWLAGVLEDTAKNYKDYDVVIAGHMLGAYYDSTNEKINSSNLRLHQIIAAFRAGKSVSLEAKTYVDYESENALAIRGELSKTYDFSSYGAFPGAVFTIHGHYHQDHTSVFTGSWYFEYNDNNSSQPDAILDICHIPDATGAGYQSQYDSTNLKGTTGEQSFSIITIAEDNTVYITRIGLGENQVYSLYK